MNRRGFLRMGGLSLLGLTVPLGLAGPGPKGESKVEQKVEPLRVLAADRKCDYWLVDWDRERLAK